MTAKKHSPQPRKTLPDALRQAIEASGKSANQLQVESGVSHTVINRFLKGERDLRLSTADKLAAAVVFSFSGPRR